MLRLLDLALMPLWLIQIGTVNRLKPGALEGSTPFSGTKSRKER